MRFMKKSKTSCYDVRIVPEEESKCAICNKSGISLLEANHKELGYLMVCQECWKKLSEQNMLVSGSSGSCECCS